MNKYIDLHLHLDGSLSENCVKELCRMQDIEIPKNLISMLRCPKDCRDLNEYLRCFEFPLTLLQTEDAITYAVEKLCYETDYRYCEIRFAPQLHCKRGLTQSQVIEAARKGLKENYRLILCCMRGGENEETLRLCGDYMGKGVVALDLAGAEALFPTCGYKHLFEAAQRMGVPYTIHAGEADGPESIRDAINMGASRIGHGVRAIEDEAVMKLLRYSSVPLEMCPTSNLNTRVIGNIRDYPIKKYIDYGITVTVNSDNMSVSDTDIKKELRLINEVFGIDESLLLNNSLDAAFN
ncbi:MAG: adenosine deaminase family protein [Clostridia bacterium]|nr:adenosine deaminase family protein [Clostridia bacterium]